MRKTLKTLLAILIMAFGAIVVAPAPAQAQTYWDYYTVSSGNVSSTGYVGFTSANQVEIDALLSWTRPCGTATWELKWKVTMMDGSERFPSLATAVCGSTVAPDYGVIFDKNVKNVVVRLVKDGNLMAAVGPFGNPYT